jgi:putative transposase
MARRKHKPEEIVAKLRQVDVLTSQGRSVAEAVRTIGVTEVSSPVASRFQAELPGQLQTSIRRHPRRPGRPNGESARARLYRW